MQLINYQLHSELSIRLPPLDDSVDLQTREPHEIAEVKYFTNQRFARYAKKVVYVQGYYNNEKKVVGYTELERKVTFIKLREKIKRNTIIIPLKLLVEYTPLTRTTPLAIGNRKNDK